MERVSNGPLHSEILHISLRGKFHLNLKEYTLILETPHIFRVTTLHFLLNFGIAFYLTILISLKRLTQKPSVKYCLKNKLYDNEIGSIF